MSYASDNLCLPTAYRPVRKIVPSRRGSHAIGGPESRINSDSLEYGAICIILSYPRASGERDRASSGFNEFKDIENTKLIFPESAREPPNFVASIFF